MLVLKVEDLGVASGSRGDESGVKELEDFVADVGELRLDPSQKAPSKEIGWSSDGVLIGIGSMEIGVLIDVDGDWVLIVWISFRWGFDRVDFSGGCVAWWW